MARIETHVWYGVGGDVVAVGQPLGRGNATPIASDDAQVLGIVVEEEDVAELHRNFRVDVANRSLVRREESSS